MPVKSYDKGDLVVLSAVFTDKNSVEIDPSTVTFKIKNPAGLVTTYIFGINAELVKDSVGNYHVNFSVAQDGYWRYRYESTGVGQAAEENQFQIKRGFF